MIEATLRLVAVLVGALPFRALSAPGRALGWAFGSVARWRRAGVLAAMRRADVAQPTRAAAAMYESLGAGVMELLWLAASSPHRRRQALAAHVSIDDASRRALEHALARGPVVLAASHTGNWELAAHAAATLLAAHGRRLAVVVKRQHVGGIDAFVTGLRQSLGLTVVPASAAWDEARRALRRGDVVAMPIDQVPDRRSHGDTLPFLGAEAWVDRAPATLACRLDATLLVVCARREGPGHRVSVVGTIAPRSSTRASSRTWIADATRRATEALEAFVRASPATWLWLHRRWRAPLDPQTGSLVGTPHPG